MFYVLSLVIYKDTEICSDLTFNLLCLVEQHEHSAAVPPLRRVCSQECHIPTGTTTCLLSRGREPGDCNLTENYHFCAVCVSADQSWRGGVGGW